MGVWAVVQAAIDAAREVVPPKGHPLRPAALFALHAAERGEKYRTPAAAEAASKAASIASEEALAWEADHGHMLDAAAWGAHAAAGAARAAGWAAKGDEEAAEEAASWAVEAALEAAGEAKEKRGERRRS